MIRSATILATALLTTLGLATAAPAAHAQVIAIEGAKVHVRPGEVIEDATVVIRDGQIQAAGANVTAPEGARTIDAAGKQVTAGFIDAYSRLGLVEVSAVRSTNEGRFSSELEDKVHAAYRVIDGYNSRSVAIPIARSGGVTSAVAVPQGGLVAGSAAWMSLADGGLTDAIVRSPAAMIAVLGARAIDVGSGSRGLAVLRLRELLSDAAAFPRLRGAYNRGQTRELAAERLDLQAMQPVLAGDIPLAISAHRASDIRVALGLAEEFDINLVIEGGTEAWILADELAAAEVPVLIDPIQNLPQSFDRVHVRDDAAAVLAEAGVPVALTTSDRPSGVRTLRQLAGNAVARGMSWDAALAGLTTVPAAIYGVDDRGAIAPGQRADLVIWSGDPFEFSTNVEGMFIGGVEQSLRTRQTELLERYLDLAP